jgi:hypothetical protein
LRLSIAHHQPPITNYSPAPLITGSTDHPITRSPDHPITRSPDHPISRFLGEGVVARQIKLPKIPRV